MTQFSSCLIEDYIEGKEITVGILETEQGVQVLPVLELRPQHEFYDYEHKLEKNLNYYNKIYEIKIKL